MICILICLVLFLHTMGLAYGKVDAFSKTGLTPSRFFSHDTDHIVVLVDAQLYPWIQKKFHRYLSEVEERFPVECTIILVNGLRSLQPVAPAEIRHILQNEYARNATIGALLVGQIPYALWKQGAGNNSGIISVFYEDLDGDFEDTDNDGFYDYHTFGAQEGPEIWVCWMRPPLIGQVFFMNRFLEKTHMYYTEKSVINKAAFVACHEDYDN